MAVTVRFNCAGLSDPGLKRENNEDRFHADPDRGIFFVIDGVGGHAAGEKAADTAHSLLRARLERQTGTPAERIREAITLANNEIFRLASENDEWHGMACVLTVVLMGEDEFTVGHVGDSRLYLLTPGGIRKVTRDHSPVGEREDRGELDEVSAMRHPRRNEVYRDVGSQQHTPDDVDFIDVIREALPADGALLLCSDGLSDLVTSGQISAIVEMNAGEPRGAVKALVNAANQAGGKDNVTVVLVESTRFAPGVRRNLSSPRTVLPLESVRTHPLASRWAFLIYGLLAAVAVVVLAKPYWRVTQTGNVVGFGIVREPQVIRVTGEISSAMANAQPGDTVLVPPGSYNEQIRLKEGVRLISEKPREAVIRSNATAVIGEDLRSGRLEGFRIEADNNAYLQVGIQLLQSTIEVVDNEIRGTVTAGIEMQSSGGSTLRANAVHAKSRAALVVSGEGPGPRVVQNVLTAEGYAAVVITGNAAPTFAGNVIRAPEPLLAPMHIKADELVRQNFVLPTGGQGSRPATSRNAGRPPAR